MREKTRSATASQSELTNNPPAMDAKRTTALKRAVLFAIAAVAFSVLAALFMDAPPRVRPQVWKAVRAAYVAIAGSYLALSVWELRQHRRRAIERESMARQTRDAGRRE